jgi:hypothetical protein
MLWVLIVGLSKVQDKPFLIRRFLSLNAVKPNKIKRIKYPEYALRVMSYPGY